jgi:hypothetical protein
MKINSIGLKEDIPAVTMDISSLGFVSGRSRDHYFFSTLLVHDCNYFLGKQIYILYSNNAIIVYNRIQNRATFMRPTGIVRRWDASLELEGMPDLLPYYSQGDAKSWKARRRSAVSTYVIKGGRCCELST